MARLTSPNRQAPALFVGLLCLVAALLMAGSATAEPPTITGKRAEAQRVLAEIETIDMAVGQAAEAYNAATLRLAAIRTQQKKNEALLGLARGNLVRAQRQLEARLVVLYTDGAGANALEVVLGATSLEDLLDRVETVDRVSEQDERVLHQVTSFRDTVRKHKAELAKARAEQERTVAERAARKREIEAKLQQRRQLLNSIRSEIARLEAEERRRAAAAAEALRRRIAANRRAYQSANATAAAQAAGATASAAAPAQAAAAAAAEAPVAAPEAAPEASPEASPAPAPEAAPPAAKYGGVVGVAMQYLGVPYKWGGASPSGFDCSGLIMYAYGKIGVSLPHYTGSLWGMGAAVSRSDLQPGDLVFFNGLGHAGIYVGGGSFIHAPRTGDVVKISSLGDSWYARTYMGARRIL